MCVCFCFVFLKYLFIQLHQVLVAACGIFHCGTRAPEDAGSVVAARRLSCPTACGILVPRPGIEPVSPALEGGFLPTGPPGKSLYVFFMCFFLYVGIKGISLGGMRVAIRGKKQNLIPSKFYVLEILKFKLC